MLKKLNNIFYPLNLRTIVITIIIHFNIDRTVLELAEYLCYTCLTIFVGDT